MTTRDLHTKFRRQIAPAVPEICSRTDRHTDRRLITILHTRYNTYCMSADNNGTIYTVPRCDTVERASREISQRRK